MSPSKDSKPVDPGVLAGLSRTRPQRRSAKRTARPDADAAVVDAAAEAVRDATGPAPAGGDAPVAKAVKAARKAAGDQPTKTKKAKGKTKKAKPATATTAQADKVAAAAAGGDAGHGDAAPKAKRGAAPKAKAGAASKAKRDATSTAKGAATPKAKRDATPTAKAGADTTGPSAGPDAARKQEPPASPPRSGVHDGPRAGSAGEPLPAGGYAAPPEAESPSGTELVATALQAAGEVTRLGAGAVRGLLSKLPKP